MENKSYVLIFFILFSGFYAASAQDSTRSGPGDTTRSGSGDTSHCNAQFFESIAGQQVFFEATDTMSGVRHFWNFGDSTTLGFGNFPYVSHTYGHPGTFRVLHVVRDSAIGCSDSSVQTIILIADTNSSCSVSVLVSRDSTINSHSYSFLAQANLAGATSDSITWSINDTVVGTGPSLFRNFGPGSYTVCAALITNLGCSSRSCQTIVVADSTDSIPGVPPPPYDSTGHYIPAYPNPTYSLVNLEVRLEKAETIHIMVYNSMGTQVEQLSVSGFHGDNRVTVPMSSLNAGIYNIQLRYGNEVGRSRVQKL